MKHTDTMIPPLIPLPTSQTQAPVQDDRAAKEDLFSTLFSPSTPRASPTLEATQLQDVRPLKHARTVSTDSEFGAFVSVPSNEDPLASASDAGPSSVNDSESRSPLQGTQFLEEVKAANERNKGILDELLYHEDDPLYFLNSQGQGQPSHVPQHSTSHSNAAPEGVSLLDLDPDEPIPEPPPPLDPLLHPHSIETALHEASNTIHEAYAPMHTSRHPSRQQNLTEPSDFGAFASASTSVIPQYTSTSPSSHHDHVRSPSLPPSPSRPSMPELQRTQTQSIFTPSISSTTSRWMSSFLSKPTTNLTFRPSLSRTPTHEDRLSASSWSSRSHSESITPPLSDVPNRAQTFPNASSEITHGTPFASQPYVAPSGAPGFAGDRTWNTSKFEFDKENVERKSVRLVGRKEMTTAVLTVDLADRLRPYFPALARLPRSWSLLYSLDQHGISLNTLYTRCDTHNGSVVVVMKDSDDGVFGAFIGEGLHPSKGGGYYGSGESFLWKVAGEDKLRVFKWTGKNDYVALCESDYLSFGGGDGHYGLYLDDTLSDGSSAPCPTFNNDPLCSPGPKQGGGYTFECVGLEVWGVGS